MFFRSSDNGSECYIHGVFSTKSITGTTSFDPLTGDLCMNATQAEVSVLAMKLRNIEMG